jgi:hypothetical protein
MEKTNLHKNKSLRDFFSNYFLHFILLPVWWFLWFQFEAWREHWLTFLWLLIILFFGTVVICAMPPINKKILWGKKRAIFLVVFIFFISMATFFGLQEFAQMLGFSEDGLFAMFIITPTVLLVASALWKVLNRMLKDHNNKNK